MIIKKGCVFFRECSEKLSWELEKDYDIVFGINIPSDFTINGKPVMAEIMGYPICTICPSFRSGYGASVLADGSKKFFEYWID